jgi:hypothetical protein
MLPSALGLFIFPRNRYLPPNVTSVYRKKAEQ